MDKSKQIKVAAEETDLHLPMGQLFYLLYSNGFAVKPDDYIEMLKITERFGSQQIDETARWICPIIATSEMEQTRFYNVIEQYKKLNTAQAGAKKEKKNNTRRLITGAALLILALLLLVLFLTRGNEVYSLNETNTERSVEKGTALLLDASLLLRNHPEDTSRIQFAWQFEDSSKATGAKVSHVFNNSGDYLVKRLFTSKTLSLSKQSDSLLVHVCNDLPKISISMPDSAVTVQEYINLAANVDAAPGTVSYYQWTVNDSSFKTRTPLAENLVFAKKGDYPVSCEAVVGTVHSPCSAIDREVIHVQDKGLHFTSSFSLAKPGNYTAKAKLKGWVTLLLLLPAATALLYSLVQQKLKKTAAVKNREAAAAPNKGPYDIPFEQNDIKLIQQERELRRTLVQMRYKAEEETLVLSVPATISSIIRSGGSPQLVFAPLAQQQQYLILIDRTNPRNMLTWLFAYLARTIADDGIPCHVFYYDKNFVCSNNTFPGGLTLQRLAEIHSNAILIIAGKAQELVYSAYPVIEEKFLRELNRWQSKAIITSTPVLDWAIKEKVLQEYMILVPADLPSLQKIIPALREKIKPPTNQLETTDTANYSLRNTDFLEVADLKSYLNNDEMMFQWLCAICIYPRLKWEVLVEIGKAILDKYGAPEKLNYSNLLKLCRISWMQQGVFPQTTRLDLLKQLTIENELCARECLLHMLNYANSIFEERGRFFEEEKKRQQLTNQFILHASNNTRYPQYAASREAFKKIWKDNAILDMPVKKYLEKSGNESWQTPVSNGNESVGLSAYFNTQEARENKTSRTKRGVAASLAALLTVAWLYLAYGGGAQQLQPYLSLNKNIGEQTIAVSIRVIKNFSACGDSLNKQFERLDGYFEFDNDRVPLVYNTATASATFDLPYQNIMTGKANMVISWDSSQSVSTPLAFAGQLLPDTITIACAGINPKTSLPIQIRFNDSSGYRDIEGPLTDALFRYKIVNAVQADFTDSSRIIYYEPNQKSRADSVAAIVQQSLGIKVNEEFISEIRTPPAVPILFLNTSLPAADSTDSATNKETAYYYHSMGDEAFQRKQYMEAIQSYKRAVNVNPKDALAYYQTGICYEMLGNAYSSSAIEAYNAAIRANPADGLFWYRRGSVKYGLKKYAEAIQDFNKVISLHTDDTQRQYGYTIYFRGKSYYYLKDLSNACADFKRASDLGVKAGKQDYGQYCNLTTVKPDCNRTFYSLKEALSVDAAMVCKLDLSKDYLSTIPQQLYNFKNLTQLNLGTQVFSKNEMDKLQKALPACKIVLAAAPEIKQRETDFGTILLDQNGYTDVAGQQLIGKVSRLLKAQPQGKIRLSAIYITDEEEKTLSGYMNTIINMFEKIGVNTKTQIEQRLNRSEPVQQQLEKKYPNAPAPVSIVRKMSIQVTGINLIEYEPASKK